MPSVFVDDDDMFDESDWLDVGESDDEENDDER